MSPGASEAVGFSVRRMVLLSFFTLGVLSSALTFGLGVSRAHASGAERAKVKLALNWKPEPQFGGFYAAQLGGHYTKNGLDVEILPGGAGTPVVQMVAAGQVDFGLVSADEVVVSRARGSSVVALFATYQVNPQGLMTHAARGFNKLGDIFQSGGQVAMQQGLPYALFLFKKYPTRKAQIVPYTGGIQNFLANSSFSQQCFVTSEPLAAKKAGAATKTFLVADEGYNPYTTVLVTRDEVLKNNPKQVQALVAAVRAGWRDYLDRPESANRLMAGLNKSMDDATFVESAKAQRDLIETAETRKSGLGVMTEERWKTLATQLVDIRLIERAPEAKSLFRNL